MVEVLEFIFSDFWHFLGCLCLIYAFGETISSARK